MTLHARLVRLPLRVRLVAGFSATMLLVLAAAGAFVYWRVEYALDRQLDSDLTAAARDVTPLVRPDGQIPAGSAPVVGDVLYQVLDPNGQVLSGNPSLGTTPLVSLRSAQEAGSDGARHNIGALLQRDQHPLRVYVTELPDAGTGDATYLVVAVRRDHRDEALLELLGQLAAAGFGALLVTAFVGERLARFALSPVERYRSQADDIIAGASGVRLDVPPQRVDEVTNLGHTLNAMLDALEEAVDRERRFVNDASHELRTPLTLLKTRVQLARRRTRTVPEHEAVLAEIETDVVRLTELAGHLLVMGNEGAADADTCDLTAVVVHEVSRRNALARAGHPERAALEVSTRGTTPVCMGSTAAAQVLGNLLDNAARHGAPPVAVAVDTVDGCGRMVVTDAGAGMDPAMLATATRRFARSAESRSREGFGLGLSLVESIVTRAGGELRLCFGGEHQCFGAAYDVPCEHGPEMSVTVLVPLAEE